MCELNNMPLLQNFKPGIFGGGIGVCGAE